MSDHLKWLEDDAIFIIREVAGQCKNPCILFSGGKDSACVLHLAKKAFFPGKMPFPLLHIDTGHNYKEVIDFRDSTAKSANAPLYIGSVQQSIDNKTVVLKHPAESRNRYQSITLMESINEFKFDACIGGARRDEEKARAKERVFSFRDHNGAWDPKHQRPEVWNIYNAKVLAGQHVRVFPLSNWTELDVWQYIAQEQIALPSIYMAHIRPVVRKNNLLVPVTPFTPANPTDLVEHISVRFRTVGDIPCTAPVESTAITINEIINETIATTISERGATRLDDMTSDSSMEQRKKEGYF